MKPLENRWRLLARVAMALAVVGVVRLVAMASVGTDLDCLSRLQACWSPTGLCSGTGDPLRVEYCCTAYSSSRTRVCCQYQNCTEWSDCVGVGCIQGVSQPVASDGPGTEHPNKNCINGRCQ
ncbi:MAG: hypothetical protein ACP5RN_06535 [Armatimonadota bacterium]|jgi:hypothetical protein